MNFDYEKVKEKFGKEYADELKKKYGNPLTKQLKGGDEMMNKRGQEGWIYLGAIIVIVILIIAACIAIPLYSVWQKGLSGKAQLKEAEWNRQIAVEEARAQKEAAVLIKEADIIRAEGIAEANRIISKTLTSEYITWKWVEGLADDSSKVIYVPTEANLPILEAGRFLE